MFSPEDYLVGYGYLAVFLLAGAAFVLFTVGLSNVVSTLAGPHVKSAEKSRTYESGEKPIGDAWIQYPVRFFIFALLFVIFDVEAIFLIAWAPIFQFLGVVGLIEVLLFIGILAVGLAYAWKKGVLRWV